MLKNSFSYILLFVVSITLFSCGEKAFDEIYTGKLEDLVVEDWVFYKDLVSPNIQYLKTIPDHDDVVILTSGLSDNSGLVIKFYDNRTSKKLHQIKIPYEGPQSIKGGMGGRVLVRDMNTILLFGRTGRLGFYDSLGQKTREIGIDSILKEHIIDFDNFMNGNGMLMSSENWLQINQNPSRTTFDNSSRLWKTDFPVEFKNWFTQINLKSGEVRHSDFKIPSGYESFKGDGFATNLIGALDSKRGYYYFSWPYSDAVFKLNNLILEEEIIPKTKINFTYIPGKEASWGEGFTIFAAPKEASSHIFLLYDSSNDLFVRASKTHESGEGETKFERTKHYVLSFYSGDWDPLGEYYFDFNGELDLENWFLTGGKLFINKPEQPDEDQYEFFRIDLSKVKK
jgi:hypothetical protein